MSSRVVFVGLVSGLLLIVGASVGDETEPKPEAKAPAAQEVSVILTPTGPSEKGKLGYPKARPVVVEATVPRFLFEIPEFKAKDPIFFRFALGETKGVPFYGALDRSPGGDYHDVLYLDKNRDLDMTNDGPPLKGNVRTFWRDGNKLIEFLGVSVNVPYRIKGIDHLLPYPCVIYFIAARKQTPKTVQIERDGWRQGEVEIGGRKYTLAFIDDDCDGNYTAGDAWGIAPKEAPLSDLLTRDATRSGLFPAWSKDEKFTISVKKIDLMGSTVTLSIAPAKETEREYFTRVMTARQSPQERQLGLDPMRPKADAKEKVKWMVGKDVKYALGIAKSPNVNKRVLLDFTQRSCKFCALMNQYTFRDREVVQLTENFVCVKIQFPTADSRKHNIEGTPTYVILDNNGAEVSRSLGWKKPGEFAAWLKSALR